jgi:hypothetical protein
MNRHAAPLIAAAFGLATFGALAATPLAKAEPRPADTARQCFYERNINNFTTPTNRLIYIRVGVAQIYRLDLMNDCPELTFRQNLRFSRSPSGDICGPVDLQIRFQQSGVRRICQVSDMRRLSPAEVAALPKRDRP